MLIVRKTGDHNIWPFSCAFGAILPMAPQRRDQRVFVSRAAHEHCRLHVYSLNKVELMANGVFLRACLRQDCEEIIKTEEEIVRTDRKT
ncbi:hypothetical protein ALC57_16680 [Trachymyrmex cornetzi]|uniref:Uncharacterized protein n=1 Tax=Trachymyrmex cornetzi TaxID=471704 RepID=A0A195DE70_9HYME|nr:hypothetical protein ALC57_16680 [Trachymyrmex cornetzi]